MTDETDPDGGQKRARPAPAQAKKASQRKRGGQPGNLNALKHGFYSRQFSNQEGGDLDRAETGGLQDEIKMLKVATRRLFELAAGCQDPDELVSVLNALGLASTRLAGMIKTQDWLGSQHNEFDEAFRTALSEVYEELDL